VSLPPPPQAAQVPAGSVRPPRIWYLLPVLIFLLLAVPSAIAFKSGVGGLTEGLTRVTVPGSTTLDLEPGTYTVFYEYVTVLDGHFVPAPHDYREMQITVTPVSGGAPLAVTSTGRNLSYRVPNHYGYSVAEFEVTSPGGYTFDAIYPNDNPRLGTPNLVLALGKDKVKSTLRTVFGVVGFFGGGFVAVVIAAIIFFLRFRNRRDLERAGFPA
jgi:hypothetical protein